MKEPKWVGLSINERYVRELEAQVAAITADLDAQLAQSMSIVRTMEAQVAELREAAQAVVLELQDCWEHTPNRLEFIIGELAELLIAEDK